MNIKEVIHKIDLTLYITPILLSVIGLIFLHSALSLSPEAPILIRKQIVSLALGIVLMLIFSVISYRIYSMFIWLLYFFSILLLLIVLVLGVSFRGCRGWLNLGIFYFQPAEIAKIVYILLLADYLSLWSIKEVNNIKVLIVPILLSFSYLLPIILQPDVSSALLFFPPLLGMLYFSGVSVVKFIYIFVFTAFLLLKPLVSCFSQLTPSPFHKNFLLLLYNFLNLPFLAKLTIIVLFFLFLLLLLDKILKNSFVARYRKHVFVLYFVITFGIIISCVIDNWLKDYQRKRLFSFLAPELDPLGAGYNVIQSKIAIGSGRIFGKGLFQGTQGRLGFLPAKHSDFIFSIIGEEMGFCGSLIVLILFFILIYRVLVTAYNARDKFGTLISIGIAYLLGINIVLNIGMVIGLLPIIGVPLPFVSYGGSALVANFIMIGILQSIYIRRRGY